jgi:hypothetical protein
MLGRVPRRVRRPPVPGSDHLGIGSLVTGVLYLAVFVPLRFAIVLLHRGIALVRRLRATCWAIFALKTAPSFDAPALDERDPGAGEGAPGVDAGSHVLLPPRSD